jgi:predicted GNAT family acetyltransferase
VERSRFVSSHGALRLETATHRNLLELVESSAAMSREESGEDPQRRNPLLFRERIASRLARRHDFVLHEGSELVFKCNVSALSEFGGQIEGVYCSPDFRRRGLGTAGTSWITEWVLGRAPRAVLLVNDANLIAKRMYTKLGYEDLYASRTIFVGPRGGGPSAD